MNLLELYIGTLIMWVVHCLCGKLLFKKTVSIGKIKLLILTTTFTIFIVFLNAVNCELFHGVIKVILSYCVLCIYFKIVFKKENSEIMMASLVLYLMLFASEAIVVMITSVIYKLLNLESMALLQNSIIMNTSIALVNLIITKLGSKKLSVLIKNTKFNNRSNILITLLILITATLILLKIPISNWNFDFEFIITMTLLICFTLVGLLILKQKSEIERKSTMYQQLAEYSDITNDLLEEYRVNVHENKNRLLIISGMVDSKNKELREYIDNLLKKTELIKYDWIGELNHIPIPGLRGFINYKMLEMESAGLNTNIYVSKELMKTKADSLTIKQKDDLYSIVGVYLDNAIQASLSSKKKEISLEMYTEDSKLIFVLANTYKGRVDLTKIDNYGYSTKGKSHGIGLHIVKNILQKETIFSTQRKILKGYFIQTLKINLDE